MSKETDWAIADKAAEEIAKQMKKYVKLENDGDKVIGAFVGAPKIRESWYDPKTEKTEKFTSQHKAEGKSPRVTFMFNFYRTKEGNKEHIIPVTPPMMSVLQVNFKTYKLILKSREKFGLDGKFFEIERSGKKGDQQTSYSVLPDDDIPADLQASLRRAEVAHDAFTDEGTKVPEGVLTLNDLREDAEEVTASAKKAGNGTSSTTNADAAEASLVDDLKKRLKQLPRPFIEKFLGRFGVTAVKDLKRSDSAGAVTFVTGLEAEVAAKAAAEAAPAGPVADPFA